MNDDLIPRYNLPDDGILYRIAIEGNDRNRHRFRLNAENFKLRLPRLVDALAEAIKTNCDRNVVFPLIDVGADPFQLYGNVYRDNDYVYIRTPFEDAHRCGDVEMMLKMAAKPGCSWTKRFLVSQGRVVDVPEEGRPNIITEASFFSFCRPCDPTMAGLEIMSMFGYKLDMQDYRKIFCDGGSFSEDDEQLFKFCIAIAGAGNEELEQCMSRKLESAECGHMQEPEYIEMLLKAGADPNGYRIIPSAMAMDPEHELFPPLYDAIKYNDEIAELLLSYGADVSKSGLLFHWIDDEGLIIEEEIIEEPIRAIAKEENKTHLLVAPKIVVADPPAYINQLRREFEAPLRRLVPEHSSILVAAMMRSTGRAPPVGLFSNLILEYCPFGFNLWPISTKSY